jgi:zinc/manganese transport system permease protein
MVGPAALARALTPRPLAALGLSAAIALVTVWAAIALSYITNWPVGFFVGALAALGFISGSGTRLFVNKKTQKNFAP